MEDKDLENNAVADIENDDFYKTFINQNSTASKTTLLKNMSMSDQLKKLSEGIDNINRELQKQVLDKHDDLLCQANHATRLQNVLKTMNSHIQNLFANVDRLKAQINGPYNALENHTKVLGRLHLASHILRQVNRIQQLSKRLANTNDPVLKATILQELEQLAADPDLTDIDAVTVELRNIRGQQQKVVKLASGSLNQGIANENVAQTSTALQIFINLGIVKVTLQNMVDVALGECRESLKSSLDISGSSSGGVQNRAKQGPGHVKLTSSQGFRTRVWSDLEKAFSEEIYQQCKQIKFLQTTLESIHSHNVDRELAEHFWDKLGDVIKEEITNSPGAVKQMLDDEYPKLLQNFQNMTQKLAYEKFPFKRSIFELCENAYLSNSLTRLIDPTQAMFGMESGAPSHEQIDSITQVVSSELSMALVEDQLSEKIAKNVAKCIKVYAMKTEQQLATGSDAAQVIGGAPNSGQQLNVQLANAMYYFKTQIQRMCINMKNTLSPASTGIIEESLEALDNITIAIFLPLVGSINQTVETIIVTIHLESDWAKLHHVSTRNLQCSPYMRELTQFLTRVYNTYLSPFENKEILSAKCGDIVIRCIELIVRHVSILRPISQGGRLRLQNDFNHLEKALKVLCPYLSDLGRPYRLLRSIATLIVQTPSEMVAGQTNESSVPPSTVLLLMFSHAGAELASPHQNTGWSLPKLSNWLDDHTAESDRLDLIAGALQKYLTLIRQKNSANFDPVYPIMKDYLESVVSNTMGKDK